mgnify:CR=1 FL=1
MENPLRYVKLLPLQGALFATHKNPGRCPGLGASAPSGRVAMGCKGGFSRPIPVGRINSEKQE